MAALALAVVAMALGAQLDVPMRPVPMSLQSLAVLGAGAFLGPVWGTVAVLVYLAAGAFGLPVFAGGASGWERFVGPTAGYLVAFPLGALLVGVAARQGWMARPAPALAVGVIGHAVLLGFGTAWLARVMGAAEAVAAGLTPFIVGGIVKSGVLAAITVALSRRPAP